MTVLQACVTTCQHVPLTPLARSAVVCFAVPIKPKRMLASPTAKTVLLMVACVSVGPWRASAVSHAQHRGARQWTSACQSNTAYVKYDYAKSRALSRNWRCKRDCSDERRTGPDPPARAQVAHDAVLARGRPMSGDARVDASCRHVMYMCSESYCLTETMPRQLMAREDAGHGWQPMNIAVPMACSCYFDATKFYNRRAQD